jgi:hypothetical protein
LFLNDIQAECVCGTSKSFHQTLNLNLATVPYFSATVLL